MIKPGNTSMPDAFKAYATRFGDTSLDKLGEMYMVSRKQIEDFFPSSSGNIIPVCTWQRKAPWGSCSAAAVRSTVRYSLMAARAIRKGLNPLLPEMKIGREDYLKLMRLLKDNKKVELEMNVREYLYDDEDLTGLQRSGRNTRNRPQPERPGGDAGRASRQLGRRYRRHRQCRGLCSHAGSHAHFKALNIQPRRTIRIALWAARSRSLRILRLCEETFRRPGGYEPQARTGKNFRLL